VCSSDLAEVAANAYATTFVKWRKEREVAQIDEAVSALKSRMKEYSGPAKQSTDYMVLAQRLQDLEIRRATATGNFRLVVPATVPTGPYAPKPVRSGILGLAIGLFAGIGLAFLLEQFDTKLHGHAEVARILRTPIVGRIPRFSKEPTENEDVLVTLRDPSGHSAEAFRVLRSNLDFVSAAADARTIMVTSCQQGEGKTVTICNLAVSLALAGKRVVIVDGDLRRPRVHTYFGLKNEIGVSSVMVGKTPLFDALQPVELQPQTAVADAASAADAVSAGDVAPVGDVGDAGFPSADVSGNGHARLYALTCGSRVPNPGELAASRKFTAMIERLAENADVVLVDTPAFLAVGDASAIGQSLDGLVFLVDMNNVRRPELEAARERLDQLSCRVLGCIVMRQKGAHGYQGYPYYRGQYRYYYSSSYYTPDGEKKQKKVRKGAEA
jgi:polysaccharide biosynthesis transport protein